MTLDPAARPPAAERATISQLQETVALLNSMIASGEGHSDTSRAMVRAALDARPAPAAAPREGEEDVAYAAWRAAVLEHERMCIEVDIYTPEDVYAAYLRAWKAESVAYRAMRSAILRAARAGAGGEGRDDGEAG